MKGCNKWIWVFFFCLVVPFVGHAESSSIRCYTNPDDNVTLNKFKNLANKVISVLMEFKSLEKPSGANGKDFEKILIKDFCPHLEDVMRDISNTGMTDSLALSFRDLCLDNYWRIVDTFSETTCQKKEEQSIFLDRKIRADLNIRGLKEPLKSYNSKNKGCEAEDLNISGIIGVMIVLVMVLVVIYFLIVRDKEKSKKSSITKEDNNSQEETTYEKDKQQAYTINTVAHWITFFNKYEDKEEIDFVTDEIEAIIIEKTRDNDQKTLFEIAEKTSDWVKHKALQALYSIREKDLYFKKSDGAFFLQNRVKTKKAAAFIVGIVQDNKGLFKCCLTTEQIKQQLAKDPHFFEDTCELPHPITQENINKLTYGIVNLNTEKGCWVIKEKIKTP